MVEIRILQDGDLSQFLAHPHAAEELKWAHPASNNKINSLIIPIGYTKEQLDDPQFQEVYSEISQRFSSDFSPEFFNLALYTGPEPDMTCGTSGGHYLKFNDTQLYQIKSKLAEAAGVTVDSFHFMVNPDAFDEFHGKSEEWSNKSDFGYADRDRTVIAGPFLNDGKWQLKDSGTLPHEMAHLLSSSLLSGYDSIFVNDYYTRRKLSQTVLSNLMNEPQLLKRGCLTEYFLEDSENRGQPKRLEHGGVSDSFIISKAIEVIKPQFHDTGLRFLDESTGITHRILAPHNGAGLMEGGTHPETGRWGMLPANDFQKAIYEIGAGLLLNSHGREPNLALLQEKYGIENIQEEYSGHMDKTQSMRFAEITNTKAMTSPKRISSLFSDIKTALGVGGTPPTYNFIHNFLKQETYRG